MKMLKKIIAVIIAIATFAAPAMAGNFNTVPGAGAAPSGVAFDVNENFTVQCLKNFTVETVRVKFNKPAGGRKCPLTFVSDELAWWAKQPLKSIGFVVACDPRSGKHVPVPVRKQKDPFSGAGLWVDPWEKRSEESRALAKVRNAWATRGWGSFPTCVKS